jgi:hypothetical protein
MSALTPDEERWIASLRRVMRKRPKTLGLWAGLGGSVQVIALTEDGQTAHGNNLDNPLVYPIADIACPSDGGDPTWCEFEDLDRPWVGIERGGRS